MIHRSDVLPERTIGLDIGDRSSHLVLLDAHGAVIERAKLASTRPALQRRFGSLAPTRVALEVGTHSPWISRLLAEYGHEVIVANPTAASRLARPHAKTDQRDAESLARVARLDPGMLQPIAHRSAEEQQDLAVIRSRRALVASRSQLVLHVRGTVKAAGGRITGLTTASFGRKATAQMPEPLAAALQPVLAAIASLSEQITVLDRHIEQLAVQRYPHTAALSQVNGVGTLTALAFVLTVHSPGRFRSRAVGAYLGLVKRKHQSGDRDPELGITKAGDQLLRVLLVQCAHHILGPFGQDSDLRRWGLALVARGGKAAKKRAVVAVARRLAVLLHALWRSGEGPV